MVERHTRSTAGGDERGEAVALERRIAAFPSLRIACLGDAMLDVEITCSDGRVSPEAPVLVLAERQCRCQPGGAANVASGLAALGVETVLAGVAGADAEGQQLRTELAARKVETLLVQGGHDRPTTRKTRFVADGQQIVRIDREVDAPIDAASEQALVGALAQAGSRGRFDAVVVSDYGKGVVTQVAMGAAHALAREYGIPLLVDPKGRDWGRYGPVDIIKPNANELAAFAGLPCDSDAQVEAALDRAFALCDAKGMVVTRAGLGASIAERGDRSVRHVPARKVEVADVCGAGDTNLAALAAMLASNATLDEAVGFAQLASSLAVQRHGNAVVSREDLLTAFAAPPAASGDKVLGLAELARQVAAWRRQGQRIGFTNGCFDLVHSGHVASLEAARRECDRLVVAVNADESVRRLKGPARPVLGETERALLLAGFAAVDAVTVFAQDTPLEVIQTVQPDVLVKGGDYRAEEVVGADFVRRRGGSVVITGLVPQRSTSSIIAAIRHRQ